MNTVFIWRGGVRRREVGELIQIMALDRVHMPSEECASSGSVGSF